MVSFDEFCVSHVLARQTPVIIHLEVLFVPNLTCIEYFCPMVVRIELIAKPFGFVSLTPSLRGCLDILLSDKLHQDNRVDLLL